MAPGRARATARRAPSEPPDPRAALYGMVASLESAYERVAHPDDLIAHPGVQQVVRQLVEGPFGDDEVLAYFSGDNALLSTLAAIALGQRTGEVEHLRERVLEGMSTVSAYARYFALLALERRVDGALLGPVLERVDDSWRRHWTRRVLTEFVRRRVAAGDDDLDEDTAAQLDPGEREWILEVLRDAGARRAVDCLESMLRDTVNVAFLNRVGKLWSNIDTSGLVRDASIDARIDTIREQVLAERPRGVVLVGEPGVGKTTILKLLGEDLLEDDWTLFEAGAVEVIAGQIYVGELENRVRELFANLCDRPRVLWIVPDLEEPSQAGRHRFSASSVLDMIWPALDSGRLRLVAEVTGDGFERLLREEPRLRTALELVRVEPTRDAETVALGHRWAREIADDGEPPACDDAVVAEAQQLAQQFLGRSAQPGALLELLARTRDTAPARAARSRSTTCWRPCRVCPACRARSSTSVRASISMRSRACSANVSSGSRRRSPASSTASR